MQRGWKTIDGTKYFFNADGEIVDNAKAFIDYLFSDEAQQLVAEAYLLPGRSDVSCDGRTNLDEIPQITCDWEAMMDISAESAAKINEICG